MMLLERIKWASAPVEERSSALLWGGFAAFLAAGAISTLGAFTIDVRIFLYAVMIVGWCVGACGMVGYVRWYFAQAKKEAKEMLRDRLGE